MLVLGEKHRCLLAFGRATKVKVVSTTLTLAEISNINIFHITQYFWVKIYKRDQWNLPNILAYISGIFNDFFKGGLVPLILHLALYKCSYYHRDLI